MRMIVSALMLLVAMPAFAADPPARANPAAIDVKFLRENAADALGDVELGRLAIERGRSQEVRDLGRQIAARGESLRSALAEAASRRNIGLPQAATRRSEQDISHLIRLNGASFDRDFIEIAYQNLRDDQVRLLARANRSGDNGVTDLARNAVEPMRAIFTQARRLRDAQLVAEARQEQQNAYMPTEALERQ
jgi:putative membrane protein